MVIIYKDPTILEEKIDKAISALNKAAIENDNISIYDCGRAPSYHFRSLVHDLSRIKEKFKDNSILVGIEDWQDKWIEKWANKK